MQELVLTDNYISELPSSIGDLTMLTNFNVDRNRLEYLPPQIGNLVNMGIFIFFSCTLWTVNDVPGKDPLERPLRGVTGV